MDEHTPETPNTKTWAWDLTVTTDSGVLHQPGTSLTSDEATEDSILPGILADVARWHPDRQIGEVVDFTAARTT